MTILSRELYGEAVLDTDNSALQIPPSGEQRYDRLLPGARQLAHNPRYSRLFAALPSPLLASADTTLAGIYHAAYTFISRDDHNITGILDDGLKADSACCLGLKPYRKGCPDRTNNELRRQQVGLALRMLGAIAFEMYFPRPDDVSKPNDGFGKSKLQVRRERRPALRESPFSVNLTQDASFHLNVERRLRTSKRYYLSDPRQQIQSGEQWSTDWQRLQAMNARGLNYFVLNRHDEVIRFTDITTQAFFAAYWACNDLSNDDFNALHQSVPDNLFNRNERYVEFWNFLAQMPRSNRNESCWYRVFEPIYDSTKSRHLRDARGRPIRSTELIYRTWEHMKATPAGLAFQDEFRVKLKTNRSTRKVWRTFLWLGRVENHTSNLITLPPADRGQKEDVFLMGCPDCEAPELDGTGFEQNNPQHYVRLSHFRLHRHCVRNIDYELFDIRRKEVNRTYQCVWCVSPVQDEQPAQVTWYDAFCFAIWLNAVFGELLIEGRQYELRLPTESQWEYACRAGRKSPFSWADPDLNDDHVLFGYCNFKPRRPWSASRTSRLGIGNAIRHPVPVDGRWRGHRLGLNPWGFCQMHGNMDEWCWDWFSTESYRQFCVDRRIPLDPHGPSFGEERVTRGGHWWSAGVECRSGYRSSNNPSWTAGCRLAAVPTGRVLGTQSKCSALAKYLKLLVRFWKSIRRMLIRVEAMSAF